MQVSLVSKPVRCAIYTRKSTEEGLDQDFNTLDAQRECAEAFISSQKHEHWIASPTKFDDGGFTGANIERPALRALLSEIEAGKIDCVVVYKVDRLSRSLLDFARIMEVFDKRNVSFVSVTQQLNSSSPMGRLTLNVLLSFAQFEREIISERTRDKMSAARRKGKWTGSMPVLGYDCDVTSRKLVINKAQAAQVRSIFDIFLERKSIGETLDEIERRGWKNKTWTTRKSKHHAGGRFTRQTLANLIANVIYVGEVRHKGEIYPGEQPPIVAREVWDRANALLDQRRRGPDVQQRMRAGAIFQGLIQCAVCGHPMVAGYVMKRGRRYSFYVCQLTRKLGAKACPRQHISARRVEGAVSEKLYELAAGNTVPGLAKTLPHASWAALDSAHRREIVEALVELRQFPEFAEFAGKGPVNPVSNEEVIPSSDVQESDSSETPEESLDRNFRLHRDALAAELLESVRNGSPAAFERLVVELLVSMGYGGSVEGAGEVVGKSGDGGIDGIIKQDKLGLDAIYIQAKRWRGNVGSPEIMQFSGGLTKRHATRGVVITPSGFSKDAKDYVQSLPQNIILVDGPQLASLMIEYGVGVVSDKTYTLKQINPSYFENL